MTAKTIQGVWSNRAFLNEPDLDLPFNDLRFATARLELAVDAGNVTGRLSGEGWGTWIAWSLDLAGTVDADGFSLRGENVIDGEQWVYDYVGRFAPQWPHALSPRDVLAGSVIRTLGRERHQSLAGIHATFIAVRR